MILKDQKWWMIFQRSNKWPVAKPVLKFTFSDPSPFFNYTRYIINQNTLWHRRNLWLKGSQCLPWPCVKDAVLSMQYVEALHHGLINFIFYLLLFILFNIIFNMSYFNIHIHLFMYITPTLQHQQFELCIFLLSCQKRAHYVFLSPK